MDRQFIGAAKAVAYAIFLLAAGVTLVRGVVSPLWGSASDFGLFGAVAAGGFGLIGLAWLATRLLRDIKTHFSNKE